MRVALAGLTMLLAGCAMTPEAPPFEPVLQEKAVMRWQRGNRTVVREALCERSASGAVRVTISEKPVPRVLLLREDGLLVARDWRGQVGAAPLELSIWASFLTIYQNAGRLPDGERELHTPGGRIAVKKGPGGLQSLSILNADTAETLGVAFP